MLYNGKGPRSLPQNQRFIMLIAFGFRVVAKIVAKRLTSHAESNSLIVKEEDGFRSKHSVLGPVLVLTLCIEDAVRTKFNPEYDPFTCAFEDTAKGSRWQCWKNQVSHQSSQTSSEVSWNVPDVVSKTVRVIVGVT